MKNWLTKIFNNVKPPLAISQEETSFRAIPTGSKDAIWEEAKVVSSSSLSIENETSSADSKEKETQILFEAFKKLTPEYFFVIAEMRNLLNSQIKKIVFHALSTGLSVEQVATHLGVSQNEVNTIYREAIADIHIQSGFIKRYLDDGVRKENKKGFGMNKQKTSSHSQPDETTKKTLLSEPLHKCLHLETRILTALKMLHIYTLEDLLQFASSKGLAALTSQRNFGKLSLDKLNNELIRKGIFNPDGSCELYKYISDSDREELPTLH